MRPNTLASALLRFRVITADANDDTDAVRQIERNAVVRGVRLLGMSPSFAY